MADSKVVGRRPLAFTSADGTQDFVPLHALVHNETGLALDGAWSKAFSAADSLALLALAQDAWKAGELSAPPVAAKSPAIVFKAACAGPEGNGITVAITRATDPEPDLKAPLQARLTLTVTEKDEYPELTGAADAAAVIGVDKPAAGSKHKAGSGLVQIKEGSATAGDGLPKSGTSVTVSPAAPATVKAADGTTDYFTLVAREGLPTSGVKVRVNVVIEVDAEAKTFSLTAEYTPDPVPTSVAELGELAKTAASIVTAEAPAGGYALPADTGSAPITLTGGAAGIAASGTACTS